MGFVTGMLSGLAARGIDFAPLLASANIERGALSDLDARVSIESYTSLYNLLVGSFDDEGFGLFSTPVPSGSFEFLCRSVITCRSLLDVLDRGARFLRIVIPDLRVTVSRDQDLARLQIAEMRPLQADRNDPRRIFAIEWMLRLLHALACWMASRELALDSVAFPYSRPPHAADYDLIYTANSTFEADELITTLNANLLDLPVRRDDDALSAFLVDAPGKIAALYRRDREMVHRVRDIVSKSLPNPVSLADVARQLNLSPRTVHRRLYEEGSSLRVIKDALRRDIALSRLEKTEQPIGQIAADLGYEDPSTFYRAFMAWTGKNPSSYRGQLGIAKPAVR